MTDDKHFYHTPGETRLDNLIIELNQSNLWVEKIKPDCKADNVFFTIRNNRFDFYHKGGKLFSFDKSGFKTHIKYAAVIDQSDKENYLSEKDLAKYSLAVNFERSYVRIKENCARYSGSEGAGTSNLFHKHSYLSNSNIVVLDIEVSLISLDKDKSHDRIDILLFNKDSKMLHFVEAKDYSNKEIWSKKTPPVIGQLRRYETQVAERKEQIISEYTKCIAALNKIFDVSLPFPIGIDDKVTLLIFGFDSDQKMGRLKELVTENPEYLGYKIYPIGDESKINFENLWNSKLYKIVSKSNEHSNEDT